MTGDEADNSLESRIHNWLTSQGYPLELESVKEFDRVGFRTFPSRAYLDNESGSETWREIDLLALRDISLDDRYLIRVVFCIECKTSAKPWLLFRHSRGRLAQPARIAQRFANDGGHRLLRWLAHEHTWPVDLFDIDQPHAHSITQAFTTGRDVAWEACLAASKAARYEASLDGHGIAIVALPLIVIDSPLYYCELSADGDIRLEAVEQGDLAWSRSKPYPFTIIRVITKDGLPQVAQNLRAQADDFLRLMHEEEQKVFDILRESDRIGERPPPLSK